MRARTGLVAAVLVAVALAGCLSPDTDDSASERPETPTQAEVPVVEEDARLSQPVYNTTIAENVKVPSSLDGKLIDNWVYRPDVAGNETFPVFINFSPYWGNLAPRAGDQGDAFSQYMIDYFVPRGYAVVLSSARGTGDSEGCFNMAGATEQQDTYDMIEHFAAESWSTGRVGAGGKSYDGTMPQGALVWGPPSLKTIFPVSGISDFYRYNYKGGIPYFSGVIFNSYYYVTVMENEQDPEKAQLFADDAACEDFPEHNSEGAGSAATGDYTAYWTERNYSAQVGGVRDDVGVFFVHGLQDWNVKPDHILPWLDDLRSQGVPVKAWLHQWTSGGTGHVYPMRADWNITMLRWLDHWLKEVPTGIMDEPLVQVQDSAGVWRNEDEWPPRRVETRTFWPAGDSLDESAPSAESTMTFSDAEDRSANGATEIRLMSAPLAEDLHYSGEPVVNLLVSSDQPKGIVIVELYDAQSNDSWDMINWGGLNLRHRDGMDDPQPVSPAEVYEVSFPLHPQDDVVPAGHMIGLRIASSGGGFFTSSSGTQLTVTFSEASTLRFPTIDALEIDAEIPQPIETKCWAC